MKRRGWGGCPAQSLGVVGRVPTGQRADYALHGREAIHNGTIRHLSNRVHVVIARQHARPRQHEHLTEGDQER